ncbi:Acyl transferase/acyl hydrolase/lysophospholipase [Penicillium cf. griseofulvum]|uniref:Acyl transferase/acyl hydrolase/lysophospholipase n=1 Tax=Penicillium cf. griseofulvum TaxID=2972120 RepID=A0A9W9T1I0_9EURO|nr:Acyl transferase/acyl hydrolase/lysophospholipase [Penicillium cf. griseofulvum]KAJ5437361.1 Acyl transferase/acyl hydrolase/lysophospholipase [Penicillium cf. griseofulvum]KAJ5441508.1 Acyl transferase/acyl hydrolase/lysophospholipase [Penicillium cf. griseofulvum]
MGLMKPVDDDSEIDLLRSLVDVRLDSLAAVEMRVWLKASLGLGITVIEIMPMASLAAMSEHVVQALARKVEGDKKNHLIIVVGQPVDEDSECIHASIKSGVDWSMFFKAYPPLTLSGAYVGFNKQQISEGSGESHRSGWRSLVLISESRNTAGDVDGYGKRGCYR